MKNKKILIFGLIIIVIGISIYLYFANKEYTYICFNIEVAKETLIVDDYLEECTSNKKLPEGVITDRSELLTDDVYTSYMQIKDLYQIGEMLYKDDFVIYEEPKAIETDMELLNEVEVMNLGSSSDEEPIRYRIYVKENKLYATNLNTSEETIIFKTEEVANIAVRPICCTGDGQLLILTTNGNVYISEKDCNYEFSFDFPFEKLEAQNIVSLKLIPTSDYDFTKNLYGINSSGEEILLQKLN